jgi:hypothetical protein
VSGVESNAARVADDVDDLRGVLADMTPANQAAAAIALPLAVEQAPRLTGRLAASLRSVVAADAYTITSDVPYAAVVHARNPWIAEVLTAREADQLRAIDDYLTARTP